jgi:hypothetical protein
LDELVSRSLVDDDDGELWIHDGAEEQARGRNANRQKRHRDEHRVTGRNEPVTGRNETDRQTNRQTDGSHAPSNGAPPPAIDRITSLQAQIAELEAQAANEEWADKPRQIAAKEAGKLQQALDELLGGQA